MNDALSIKSQHTSISDDDQETENCLYQLTDRVKLLQKAGLWFEGKFLILKRPESDKSRAGKWDLPGGNSNWPIEQKKDIENPHFLDIAREIFEETQIDISIAKLEKSQQKLIGTYFEHNRQVFSIIVGWKIELDVDFDKSFDPKNIVISKEHTEYKWIYPQDLHRYDLGFAGGEKGFITRIVSI